MALRGWWRMARYVHFPQLPDPDRKHRRPNSDEVLAFARQHNAGWKARHKTPKAKRVKPQ